MKYAVFYIRRHPLRDTRTNQDWMEIDMVPEKGVTAASADEAIKKARKQHPALGHNIAVQPCA